MTDPERRCGRPRAHPAHGWISGRRMQHCPGVVVAPVDDDPALLEASMLLARVRYLHKPVPNVDDTPWKTCGSCGRVDLALSWVWPCDTARIVYTDEEIRKATT